VAIGLVAVAFAALWLARRTDWGAVDALPIVGRRRAGQILRAAGGMYRRRPLAMAGLGLIYLPTAVVIGLLAGILGALPLIREVLDLAGTESGSGLLIALLIGGFANAAAFVAVNAMVATYLTAIETAGGTADETGATAAPMAAAERAWAVRRPLLIGLARSYAVVIGLLVTIVGTPWAIRQLVRYQFMPHVVVVEGEDGRGALARSSALVSGRWLHTAAAVMVINGLVTLAGWGIGLLILVVFTGVPLWLFSALITLVYALVAPVAAIAMTLLYGDAVAQDDGVVGEPAASVTSAGTAVT
jgi:hypothetical protein